MVHPVYERRFHKVSFPRVIYRGKKPNLMEIFIGTETASVELFFKILISGMETSVISWDQVLYPSVVEVCRLPVWDWNY